MRKAKKKDAVQHIDLPADGSNGMVLALLRNISPSNPETKVGMLGTSAKPQLVKLAISPKGERTFSVAGSARRAIDFTIKVEIGGVKGAVAPLVGKQPPDTHIWMSTGISPTFVRSEGPFYQGGPIWRTDLATLRISDRDLSSQSEHSPQRTDHSFHLKPQYVEREEHRLRLENAPLTHDVEMRFLPY
jgi:hypothetical protein